MRTYTPSYVGKDDGARREFQAIVLAANRADPCAWLQPLSAVPDRPQTGQIVYADGSNWDPGSGEGVYVYKSSATWVFLG